MTAVGLCGSDRHWFVEGGIGDAVLTRAARPRTRVRRHDRVRPARRRAGRRSTRPTRAAAARSASSGQPHLCPELRFAGHGSTDGALRTLPRLARAARAPRCPTRCPTPRPSCSSRSASRSTRSTSARAARDDRRRLRLRAARAAARPAASGRRPACDDRWRSEPAPRTGAPRAERLGADPARATAAGVDVAFEVAGEDAALADAIDAVRPGGRVVVVGIPDGDRTSFTASTARRKGLTLLLCRRMEPADLPRAIRLVETGRVELAPLVSGRYALSDWSEAFGHLVERRGLKASSSRNGSGDGGERPRYAVGVDFGTESGRAVLVDCADGRELGTAVYAYRNGVIDERLPAPDDDVRLEPDWALQDPEDYVRTFQEAVPALLAETGVDPADVVGVGIDFTACTMLPTLADGTPLCLLDELRRNPHAWVKLWKHHAAQPEADRINAVAAERGEPWLPRYGGKISSEWFFAKALQILDEAPEVYDRADRLIEAADWVVWQLTGVETRNTCTAGYKAMWSKRDGFPPATTTSPPSTRASSTWSTRRCRARSSPIGEPRRRPERAGRGLDGPAARHGRRGRERRRPRLRAGGDRDGARDDGRDHGHEHLPHPPRRRARDGRRDVRRRRGRHRPRPLRLRGRPVGGRRHLRLVRRERASRPSTTRRPRRSGIERARGARGGGGEAAPGRERPARARLVEREPLGARRRRSARAARRHDARDEGAGDLPRPDRGDRVRDAGDRRRVRVGRRSASTGSSPAAACRSGTGC